jgi:hypothetical protein
MPDGDDPDDVGPNTVEESVRADDDFAMRKLGELRKTAARPRESFEAAKNFLRTGAESGGGRWVVQRDVGKCV